MSIYGIAKSKIDTVSATAENVAFSEAKYIFFLFWVHLIVRVVQFQNVYRLRLFSS